MKLFPFPDIRISLLPPDASKRAAPYFKNFLRFILFFDKVFLAPFPFIYHALRPDQKLSARALSISFLVVGFTFLPELFDSDDQKIMWSYKLPIEISVFLGYFLARVGWHEVAALLTALVLTVEYHYSVSLLPKVYDSVVQLSGLFVPFMLLVITNHWLVVLLFYFTNVFMFIYYVSTYPAESGIHLEINLIAVVISMMLYSSCAHNFNHWLLKQNEQRYVQFFRENFEAIAVVDWQGVIREVNQSFATLFYTQKQDASTQEFEERSIFEFISADHRPQLARLFLAQGDNENIQVGDIPRLELNGLRMDGEVIRVQAGLKMLRNFHGFSNFSNFANQPNDLFSFGDEKKTTVFMLSFHDLTAHYQAQAALLEAEREKHANDAKSKFLANMSHEIRTPLNGVLGMLQLMEDTPLNKEQRLFLKNSVDSANYLLLLINDILDFSKIEAGLLPIDEYEFKLAECIESVVDLLHSNARTKGIDLYALIGIKCPLTILGDAARLRQVLMNLVSNAIKFTTKGKVLVQCDVDMLADDIPLNSLRLRFQVIDSGIGLKPESIDRLFQRFYQVDDQSALRRNHGGTGLGLAISRNLVGLMGGDIGVTSKYGEGSTFWFTLTCKKPPPPPTASPPLGNSSNDTPMNSSSVTTYADLAPQQLQQQLQHQLQKELHYQLHQQQSAARSYYDLPAMSQLQQQQQQQQQQQHRQYIQIQEEEPTPISPPPGNPLSSSRGIPLPSTSIATPSIRAPPTFSIVPPLLTQKRSASNMENTSAVKPLVPVTIVVVSENPHTRGIMWEYFQSWGYSDVIMFKFLEEGVKTIIDRRDDEAKLIIILCNKGPQLDSATQDNVKEIKKRLPGNFPFFVLIIDKAYVKASVPKVILPQATLCYPIRQTQVYQLILDIRDPSKQFVTATPASKNSKDKSSSTMPRVLYIDSSHTSRMLVKQMLQNDGISCEAVQNIRETASTLVTLPFTSPVNTVLNTKFPYDIVLVDFTGDPAAIQCTEEIRNIEKKYFVGARVPIIAVTADPQLSLNKCVESGMDGMCNFALQQTVPVPDLLISVVRQWLQHTPRLNSVLSPSGERGTNRSGGSSIGSFSHEGGKRQPEIAGEAIANLKDALSPVEQKKILVVEDNAMNQVVVSTFLKKAGYSFEFASDGQQGVDMYVSNSFGYHLILMDCQMPVMDGYEASIRIRENEALRKIRAIPIVAMTAAALVMDRERCLSVGMSDFVQKPIQRPLFLEIIQKWLK